LRGDSRASQVLINDGTFSLPSKRQLAKSDSGLSIAIIALRNRETERPKHNQKASYSGKKTPHNKRSSDLFLNLSGKILRDIFLQNKVKFLLA
jgi:hypothetical protein